eukprot:GHVU01038148.1.p3 GENE.GHVU01038148.1~~GHVU01038148.1.p3  ORF type:complete len:111 (-),score=8.22 GHVU01038148.1:507-839(-)
MTVVYTACTSTPLYALEVETHQRRRLLAQPGLRAAETLQVDEIRAVRMQVRSTDGGHIYREEDEHKNRSRVRSINVYHSLVDGNEAASAARARLYQGYCPRERERERERV